MAGLLQLVDHGIELVNTGERSDLRRRLEQTRARLLDPNTRVMVVGEFKQGKSQLVNALLMGTFTGTGAGATSDICGLGGLAP